MPTKRQYYKQCSFKN